MVGNKQQRASARECFKWVGKTTPPVTVSWISGLHVRSHTMFDRFWCEFIRVRRKTTKTKLVSTTIWNPPVYTFCYVVLLPFFYFPSFAHTCSTTYFCSTGTANTRLATWRSWGRGRSWGTRLTIRVKPLTATQYQSTCCVSGLATHASGKRCSTVSSPL